MFAFLKSVRFSVQFEAIVRVGEKETFFFALVMKRKANAHLSAEIGAVRNRRSFLKYLANISLFSAAVCCVVVVFDNVKHLAPK